MNIKGLLSTAAILAAVSAPYVVACGSGRAPGSSDGVGRLQSALSATGPDGATYTLPAGAALVLTPTGEGPDAGSITLSLDANMATELFSVPAGTYQGTLTGGGPTWALERAGDGGATSVQATLIDPQPYDITVTTGQTTQLAFDFELQGIGDITFGTGNIGTSITVAPADGGTPTSGTSQGLLAIEGLAASKGPAGMGSSAITSLISSGAPATFDVILNFDLAGPFVAGVDSVCAPISGGNGNVKPVTSPSGGGTDVSDLFGEAFSADMPGLAPPSGTICIYDTNGYNVSVPNNPSTGPVPPSNDTDGNYPNAVVITLTRTGQPTSPTVTKALAGNATDSYTFTDIIVGSSATPLYNGQTATLSALAQSTALTVQETLVEFDPGLADQVVADSFVTNAQGALANVGGQSLSVQLSP